LSEITHVRPTGGDPASDVSLLLGLEGLAVTQVEIDECSGARVVHVLTADEGAAACPSCGVFSTAGKGWVQTRPRDIPYGTGALRLVWRKRRWRCGEVVCERGSFTEAIPAVPTRARLTVRLRAELARAVAEQHRCVAETAAHYKVGWATVHEAFIAHVAEPLAQLAPPVRVLGIAETRRGKPIWTQDPDTDRWQLACDRWHTGFVDAAGSGGLLAQVEGRSAAVVTAWLTAQPQAWRLGITHVAIDLSASYAKAVREGLPDAVLVADRFHVIRLANDTVTAVRQRVIREDQGRRGRKTDPAWRVRRRLLTAHERLRPETFARMWNALVDTGDPGQEILHAYVVKEELRALLALSGTHPEPHILRRALHHFYASAAASGAPEVHRLAPPSRPGGLRSKQRSSLATPTPAPRATTGSRNTKAATPSDSATRPTNAAAYAGPAPANTGKCQPPIPSCPVKCDEPLNLGVVMRCRRGAAG